MANKIEVNNFYKILGDLTIMINNGQFNKVIENSQRIVKSLKDSKPETILKSRLLGLIIDAISENKKPQNKEGVENTLKSVIDTYEKDKDSFLKCITASSYHYCLGNAYNMLYDLERSTDGFIYSPERIKIIITAKNHFWKAYKLLNENDDTRFSRQVIKNLGSCLTGSGRVVEALQYYDIILKEEPTHPYANGSRGEDLWFLKNLSNITSIEMIMQTYQNFDVAAKNINIRHIAEYWKSRSDSLKSMLVNIGYDIEHYNEDVKKSRAKAKLHSKYRKFCIDNFLTINEHSIYCSCVGAEKDDLSIPTSAFPIMGIDIPKMEFLLNHIKVQYGLARRLYYEGINANKRDSDVLISNLHDNANVTIHSEKIKTSFILCFSILDKIAHGICEFFDLAVKDEKVYFQSFWRSNPERWKKINQLENIALIALFSQATDLNEKEGEWAILRNWRNAIEHNLLILTEHPADQHFDVLHLYDWKKTPFIVKQDAFFEKSLQLLRFVKSSIFYFTFCVRIEGIKEYDCVKEEAPSKQKK